MRLTRRAFLWLTAVLPFGCNATASQPSGIIKLEYFGTVTINGETWDMLAPPIFVVDDRGRLWRVYGEPILKALNTDVRQQSRAFEITPPAL